MRHACRILLGVLTPGAATADEYVWVEAESAVDKVEHANEWYEPVARKTSLPGGDWWRSFDEPVMDSGYMACPFRLPKTGKNPTGVS